MTDEMKTRLERLAKMEDKDIELDDIPEITHWDTAVRGKFYRPVKKAHHHPAPTLTYWLGSNREAKYQAKINTVLREYVHAGHA